MNADYSASVFRVTLCEELVETFSEQFRAACWKYSVSPSNSSQMYVEKLGVRKGKALEELLDGVCESGGLVIDHCLKCDQSGSRLSGSRWASPSPSPQRQGTDDAQWASVVKPARSKAKSWVNKPSSPSQSRRAAAPPGRAPHVDTASIAANSNSTCNSPNATPSPSGKTAYRDFALQQQLLPRPRPGPSPPPHRHSEPPPEADLADATFEPRHYQIYNNISYHVFNRKNEAQRQECAEKIKNRTNIENRNSRKVVPLG
jgi:hypothetical protein